MFDWNDLRIFLAVARNGSALAAAQKLNLNQTTVSRRIDALEHALGICLFLRDTRGSTLTPQGSHLLLHAEAVESAARAFDGEAGRLRRDLSGEICVTAPEVIMAQFIGPLTQNFRTLHPEIRFAYLSAEHHLDLAKGEADVAFRAGSEIVGDTLVRVALPDVIWSAYCSERYRDKSGMPDRVADLRQHSIVTYGSTAGFVVH